MCTIPRGPRVASAMFILGQLLFCKLSQGAEPTASFDPYAFVTDPQQIQIAKMQVSLFEDLSRAPVAQMTTTDAFAARRESVRRQLLDSTGLNPRPATIPLDLQQSTRLDHPWCTLRKVRYQIWPGIYSEAFLYEPKSSGDTRKPAILSLTGHWPNGKANADEQIRCLNFARLGFVVLAPDQDHYEDLPIGISHQTHMIWSNVRALDLLTSLTNVDKDRIGACGGSGGGYQVQMLLALDHRLRAATIMGFTCDWRETIFPHVASCGCLHYPGAIAVANMPEISAMGMPVPVQYLTMNDYTKNFRDNALPTIKEIYSKNGFDDRISCLYWPTEHAYDKPKRQATYSWMRRWLCGDTSEVEEVETPTFPIPRLIALDCPLSPHAKKLEDLTSIYSAEHKYTVPQIESREQWVQDVRRKTSALNNILGISRQLPITLGIGKRTEPRQLPDARIETIDLPVEGSFRIPLTILRPLASNGRLKPVIVCCGAGRKRMLADPALSSMTPLLKSGCMVLVPDLRFFGEIDLDNLIGVGPTSLMTFVPAYSQDNWLCNQDYSFHYHITRAWQRDSIVWGRPLVGMMVTDIAAIVDHLQSLDDVDMSQLEIAGSACPEQDADYSVPLAALFAAALDARLKKIDVDLGGKSFEDRTLPPIPFVLWSGDVLQWSACAADRHLTLRNVSSKSANIAWLKNVFSVVSNSDNLQTPERP